jgi:hypothetical protein
MSTSTDKKPSSVKLTAFSLYRVSGTPGAANASVTPVCGAVAGRFGADSRIELLADSVPFHSASFKGKAPKEGFGMLMLYGVRDTLEEMHYWRTEARKIGAEFAHAEIEFLVGDIEVGLTDRAKLKANAGKGKFLNLRRMTSSLQTQVLTKFGEYAVSEGANIDDEMSRVSQIATRPDFFDRLLQEDHDLAKLDVLVIPVSDDPEVPGRMRQVAYVKPGAQVVSIVQGTDAATLLLPKWMSDAADAKKLRKQVVATA